MKNSEGFDSVPQGYKKGQTKFIIITGSVLSGVGKGTFTSAMATLLQFYNLKLSMIKFDGYLNVDAGTLNPYRHGEVFVLEDGTETDLDLGSYERALHRNLSKNNYLTSGKIFDTIIKKERQGEYLGRDVQFIPHVTGEIKKFLRTTAMKDSADILIIEVGGTIGDLENSYFLEAMRELRHEEGQENVCIVNVTYIIEPSSLGEQKSKAAQQGIQKLMSLGVQPDVVVCRAVNEVKENVREKLSLVSNLPLKNIISLKNMPNVYDVPFYLAKQGLDKTFFELLKIRASGHSSSYEKMKKMVFGLNNPKKEIEIAITGKYTGVHDSYLSILKALEHASALLRCKVKIRWLESSDILTPAQAESVLSGVQGLIVPGGFGERGAEGKILCINYARTHNIPYLGLCFGMQLAVIEYARDKLRLSDANTTEINPRTRNPVIDILPEQKEIEAKGATMRRGAHLVQIKRGSRALSIYKRPIIKERFRHRYEVNPEYIPQLEQSGLIFSGISKEDKRIMQVLELPKSEHPFFMATQFHPELISWPLRPHPLFIELVKSGIKINK